MSAPRVVLAVLLRTAALAAVAAVAALLISRSDSTDPLGAGLLTFVALVLVAGLWALVDGWRTGFVATALVWLLASVLGGAAITVVLVVTGVDGSSFADAIGSGTVFFGLLVLVPALVGAAVGGVVHRLTSRDGVPAAG